MDKMKLLYCFAILILPPSLSDHPHAVVPTFYTFPTTEVVSANGSSADRLCSNVTITGNESTCNTPPSSVLFDGVIPTLTGLDGDMWASQLVTLQTAAPFTELTFDFSDTHDYVGLETVEVVMFNCPERGISVTTIQLLNTDSEDVGSLNISTVSCDSLLRVCLDTTLTMPMLGIQFELAEGSDKVYLAEVIFDGTESPCSAAIMVLDGSAATTEFSAVTTGALSTGGDTDAQTTTLLPAGDTDTLAPPTCSTQCLCPPCPTLCRPCTSCSRSTTLASVVSILATALLATAIFVLVQIVLCKCCPWFKHRRADAVTYTMGEGSMQHLEEEDGGVVIMHNPVVDTYMQAEGGEGEEEAEEATFELQGK